MSKHSNMDKQNSNYDEFVELNKEFQVGLISAREYKERWESLIQKVYVEDYDSRVSALKQKLYGKDKNQA